MVVIFFQFALLSTFILLMTAVFIVEFNPAYSAHMKRHTGVRLIPADSNPPRFPATSGDDLLCP